MLTAPALLGSYGLVLIGSLAGLRWRRQAGLWLLAIAFAFNTIVLADRWIEAGRAPFKTLYETLLFYPWCVALVTLILVLLYRLYVLIPFGAIVSIIGLIYALARPDVEIVNLPPALQSGWFVPHVVTYFISYSALFASFVLAVMALTRPQWKSSETGQNFEEYSHRAAMFGFTALTAGLVMGAAWGKAAWGDYWSWDPKENWALVTWLAYLIYLHLRLVSGWKGRRAMIVSIASFAAVVFTYLGMSMLPTATGSLHIYQ